MTEPVESFTGPYTGGVVAVRIADTAGPAGRVRVFGEIDAATAPELRRALEAELVRDGPLVVDCEQVSFIDGSGLKVLEWAATAFAPRPVELRAAPPLLRELAAITGLDRRVVLAPPGRMVDEPARTRRGTVSAG
jgi:anti-anti-sigma factor